MNKDRLARIVTMVLVLAGAAFLVLRQSGARLESRGPVDTPQYTIDRMLNAARDGDAAAFLAQYTGQMAASLKQTMKEQGDSGFRDYLRSSNAAIKGVALNESKPLSAREVEVRVEYVYQDRNEVQVMRLEKIGGAWKIALVENANRVKTLIPYGTPIQ